MLAFALDITQNKPKSSKESDNDELKQYMDYQRKLNHVNLVKKSLEYIKDQLQENMDSGASDKLSQFLQNSFPLSSQFADADVLVQMLRKLMNAQNTFKLFKHRQNLQFYVSLSLFKQIYLLRKVHNLRKNLTNS